MKQLWDSLRSGVLRNYAPNLEKIAGREDQKGNKKKSTLCNFSLPLKRKRMFHVYFDDSPAKGGKETLSPGGV